MSGRQGEIGEREGVEVPYVQEGLAPDAAAVEAVERGRLVDGQKPAMPVHPIAALFPMMTDEELDALAADIKANGLRYPIIRDRQGVIWDGRNRLEACRRAERDPEFALPPEGADPVAFILSVNAARRQMTRNQMTMLATTIAAEAEKTDSVFSSQWRRRIIGAVPLTKSRVRDALVIYQYAPEQVPGVIEGTRPFDTALADACQRRDASKNEDEKLGALARKYPDLAEKVRHQEWTLEAALMAGNQRDNQKATEKREYFEKVGRITRRFNEILTSLDPAAVPPDAAGIATAARRHPGRLASHPAPLRCFAASFAPRVRLSLDGAGGTP